MRDVRERIQEAVDAWRTEVGSEPDTLFLGRQEFALLEKATPLGIGAEGQPMYDGMRIIRNKRPQHLTLGRA